VPFLAHYIEGIKMHGETVKNRDEMLLRSRKYIMSEWRGYIEGAVQLPTIAVSLVMEWF
jgi:hypothetical protein